MSSPTQADIDNFMIDLTAISTKYNIWIGGCGCSNSPWGGALSNHNIPKYTYSSGVYPVENIKTVNKRLDGYTDGQ